MTAGHDPGPGEGRLVAVLREHVAPRPLTASRRAAMLAEAERRSRAGRTGWLPLAGASALAVAAVAALVVRVLGGWHAAPAPSPVSVASSWDTDLLDPASALHGGLTPGALPDDYELLRMVASAVRTRRPEGS